MIFLILPCNYHSGWGVCSTNLAKEISQKHKIKYVSDELKTPSNLEEFYFKSRQFDDLEYLKNQKHYPIIQAVQHDLNPYMGYLSGSVKVCLTFSDRKIPKKFVEKSKHFDYIIAGSEWCKQLLLENNVNSIVIHQGIDPLLFNKQRSNKVLFQDEFVIFSGGKYEHRKGQDITIKAFKVLQDRHPDVKLVCAWHNPYTDDTGQKSLIDSGIDMNKVIMIPSINNYNMPLIYQNTDVGIFPSRCEAGTNLVLMEYMACGKPVIASVETGQKDIVNDTNGLIIKSSGKCGLYDTNLVSEFGESYVSYWEEPNVESCIENLEFAYKNRNKISSLGIKGANLMKNYTWKHMSDKILNLFLL